MTYTDSFEMKIVDHKPKFIHIYYAVMNRIFDEAEKMNLVVYASSYDNLVRWIQDREFGRLYRDQVDDKTYTKYYKRGTELENYNPLLSMELGKPGIFGDGIYEDWVDADMYLPAICIG